MDDLEAERLLAALDEHERRATWRLARVDGALRGRGVAVVDLLAAMSLTRPAARVLGAIPAGVLDGCYALVARLRGVLGRLVPDGPAPRKFP